MCLLCKHMKKECIVIGEEGQARKQKLVEELGSGKRKRWKMEVRGRWGRGGQRLGNRSH